MDKVLKKTNGSAKDDKFIKAPDGLKLKSWRSHQKRRDYQGPKTSRPTKDDKFIKAPDGLKLKTDGLTKRDGTIKVLKLAGLQEMTSSSINLTDWNSKADGPHKRIYLMVYKKITRSPQPVKLFEEADGMNRCLG